MSAATIDRLLRAPRNAILQSITQQSLWRRMDRQDWYQMGRSNSMGYPLHTHRD